MSAIWLRIGGWALVVAVVLLSLVIVPAETNRCEVCGRPTRLRRARRSRCALHGGELS